MEKIQLTARFGVHPGKIGEFRELMDKCIGVVREKEPGTLQYDWFHNADQTEFVVRESYANPEAVFVHMENVGPYLARFLAITDFSGEVFGNPPEALRKSFAAFDVKFYAFAAGA